uniref:calmodulin binding protein PICBP-like n=1 Tax=Erigeron canadensis TaxID=72917 RepID=UPI001CB96053|nr:calmodulin binding protein PICBP-like [Erigeron canadensis]XP_043610568.1 calmodulin binding protein PICBP-like [Erigeron canadensis]
MTFESSLTQDSVTEKKKLQLDYLSPESSLTQVDSDSESTSASSSMQSSVSSATSSIDHGSSNVNDGTQQKKTLNNSFSKKFATFGSFMSYRRRTQSKLSQTSIKLSDDGSTTSPQSSSIEVSDESSNYVEKPMPKFTRNGSLRSVKILRSKSKNKSTLKSKKSSIKKNSEASGESHSERATFSSILKDSKFPEQLKHQPGPSEPEEVLPIAKLCPYQHCSLHGHHHHHEPPQKRFEYLKRRTTKEQKIIKPKSQPMDKSSIKKREVKGMKKVSNNDDFSIEFYAKPRSEPLSSHDHDDAEFADILFGVNSFQEIKNEVSISNNHDFNEFNYKKDENSNGSTSVLENKQSLKKTNQISMWHMIHQHMVTGLAAESGEPILQEVDEEKKAQTKDFDDATSQESEIRKMFAIKLVRDAIEKILLPEVQDDQSTTSEVISEQDLSENNQNGGEITTDQKETAQVTAAQVRATKTEKGTPNRWSYLKKVILLTKFVKELEKVKKFNPKKPRHLPVAPEAENETVSLRRQTTGDKKNSDEWMLDYALQKVVGELAPTQKRKVALLVKAFETVAPAQDDPQESGSNSEIQSVGSESKSKFQGIMQPTCVDSKAGAEIKMTPPVVPSSFAEKNKESKSDLEKEKHIKMWHMIYQHVAKDIVTRVGSELLLDGEESTNGEEKNLQEVEDQTERNYRLQFTQSDAFKLVQESVDEILLPDVPDNSSQDTQSVASDIASDQGDEEEPKKIEKDLVTDENKVVSAVTRLQQQKSQNWSKLKKLILLKRSIKALEGFRQLKPQTPQREIVKSDREEDKVDLRRQMIDERKKAEQWMLDYAVQHIVTKLTPARKKRVSMLVEAFEAVVPFPEI